ncbi:unnamed protein product [Tuwongella immobilis]|uniref:Uncharacterized protein n=1 Tax=Tuwongella immobilis TaxID=692036 RepID=A0A6C2YPR5_9BACT|nr:unnamed protein product [Tuwongella immobilis]VTS04608.1 unnamed protein product [Tuwongella immobilis]
MTQHEAEAIAMAVLRKRKTKIRGDGSICSRRCEPGEWSHSRAGWSVSVRLDVPDGWEADSISVHVFEPDGDTYIPMIL